MLRTKLKVMPSSIKSSLKEEYTRLKKALQNILKPKKESQVPPLAWQPIRPDKNLRGTDLR
jgi:hypothetical protein